MIKKATIGMIIGLVIKVSVVKTVINPIIEIDGNNIYMKINLIE